MSEINKNKNKSILGLYQNVDSKHRNTDQAVLLHEVAREALNFLTLILVYSLCTNVATN